MMIIYKAINKINGKIYVGQTARSLKDRIAGHLRDKRKNHPFPLALREYGVQSFEFSIIDEASSREVLHAKEQYWIKQYSSRVPQGYNLTAGGGGPNGYNHTDETLRKMSESKAGEKNPIFGTHPSEETKKKISEAIMGKRRSATSRRKQSEARLGKQHSAETKRKMSEARTAYWAGKKNPDLAAKMKLCDVSVII